MIFFFRVLAARVVLSDGRQFLQALVNAPLSVQWIESGKLVELSVVELQDFIVTTIAGAPVLIVAAMRVADEHAGATERYGAPVEVPRDAIPPTHFAVNIGIPAATATRPNTPSSRAPPSNSARGAPSSFTPRMPPPLAIPPVSRPGVAVGGGQRSSPTGGGRGRGGGGGGASHVSATPPGSPRVHSPLVCGGGQRSIPTGGGGVQRSIPTGGGTSFEDMFGRGGGGGSGGSGGFSTPSSPDAIIPISKLNRYLQKVRPHSLALAATATVWCCEFFAPCSRARASCV